MSKLLIFEIMKLEVIFFFVLASVLVTKQDSELGTCQDKADGELKNKHITNWYERDSTCYSTAHGMLYSGKLNVTRTGRPCQAWSIDTPHAVTGLALNDCNYPERSRLKAKNYCRNPLNSYGGPWCYTTDSKLLWDYCEVSLCPEVELEVCRIIGTGELKNNHSDNWHKIYKDCYSTKEGMLYSGKINVTITGRTCQAWIDNTPHVINNAAAHDCNYPERSRLKAKNYCRNPTESVGGPWCYTTDPDKLWEFCKVHKCRDYYWRICHFIAIGELLHNHRLGWFARDHNCTSTPRGMLYSGRLNVTKSGRTCQAWSTNTPHRISGEATKYCNYPDQSLEKAKNYCRNPTNSEGGVWCYTTDPEVEKENCVIPKCPFIGKK